MKTIDQMVAIGQKKLQSRIADMPAAYNAAKQRAITGYNETPFNQRMKTNYAANIQSAEYVAPDPAKWARNFRAKVS